MRQLRYVPILCILGAFGAAAAAPEEAPDLTAKDVLQKVTAAYSHITSVRIKATREQNVAHGGRTAFGSAELDMAADGSHRYAIRFIENGRSALAVSDGDTTWRARLDQKFWTQMAAASIASADVGDTGAAPRRDLFTFATSALLGQFVAIAKQAEDPQFVRSDAVKVSETKIPCYVVRCRAGKVDYDLWIDKERFLVLQDRERMEKQGDVVETKVKLTALEINPKLDDSLFHFQPGKGWKEAESLLLPGEDHVALAGTRATNFALKTLDGESVQLDQTRGKVVVLDFWATWCPPCRVELPSIEKLRGEFGDAVQFYGVNDEEPGTVRSFVKGNHYAFAVLMDGKAQVHRLYGVSAIPTVLIIDKQGVIREQIIGSRSESNLRKAIQSVLASN
jgi:peroxiredoxin/outer membrane lipoprotein-sorting protein